MRLRQFLPFLQWMPRYSKSLLRGDLSAGLTVGVMLIPQGMAYGMLAGMPPIYGLYASVVPLIMYALLGTSRQLAVGPVAMVALLISTGVGELATPDSESFIALALMLSLMVGVILLLLGLLRLGFLVNFLSHPVLSGFTSAAALIIGFSQLKYLLGLELPRTNYVHKILLGAVAHADQIHLPTLLLGLGGIAVIIFVKRLRLGIPGPLVAVFASILLVWAFGWHRSGMNIVGEVPSGLPPLSWPQANPENIRSLLPIAITIALVGFMESIAVAKSLQARHKSYRVDSNQELVALGVSNLAGSFFSAFPTMGGFGRTAVNDQSGANTGLASLISAGLILLTLLFLTPLFYYLPEAVLASVIMVAVAGLVDFKEARHLWRADKRDFWMLIATFLATLSLGIEEGIAVGVVLSLVMVVYRTTYPHVAVLGQLPSSRQYRNIARFPQAIRRPEALIFRFDAQLFFANTAMFRERLAQEEAQKGPDLKLVVLDFGAINGVDSSAVSVLFDLLADYRSRGITLYLSAVRGPVRDTMARSGFMSKVGKENYFLDNAEAIDYWERKQESEPRAYAGAQTNVAPEEIPQDPA